MSMDFQADIRVASTFDYGRSLCPACGGRHRFAPAEIGPEAKQDCESCYGDGADWQGSERAQEREAEVNGHFNVSTSNGFYILQEILGISNPDACGGIDPTTVLTRLAVFTEVEACAGALAPSQSRGVYMDENGVGEGALVLDFGRGRHQVDSYLVRLKRCAEIAHAHGVEVVWS